jgi:hypothetical protein
MVDKWNWLGVVSNGVSGVESSGSATIRLVS